MIIYSHYISSNTLYGVVYPWGTCIRWCWICNEYLDISGYPAPTYVSFLKNSEQTLYFCFDDLTLPLGPLKCRLRQSIGRGTWTRLPWCLGRWWFSIMIEKIIPRVIIGMGLIESYDCWLSKSWLLIDECWLSKSHGPTGIWLCDIVCGFLETRDPQVTMVVSILSHGHPWLDLGETSWLNHFK